MSEWPIKLSSSGCCVAILYIFCHGLLLLSSSLVLVKCRRRTVTGCSGGWSNDYDGDEDNDEWVRRQTWSRSSTKTTLNNVWTCLGFTLWAQHGPRTNTTAHPKCCLVIVVLCHKRIVWILNKRLLRINLFMILAVPFRQKPNALWTLPRRVGQPSWSEDRMWGINTRTLRKAMSCCLC